MNQFLIIHNVLFLHELAELPGSKCLPTASNVCHRRRIRNGLSVDAMLSVFRKSYETNHSVLDK